MKVGDERCAEWMERFVCTFEAHWSTLIDYYKKQRNTTKWLEWICFAAMRGDGKCAALAAE